MSRIAMATFGDDRLLDLLPSGINSLPQQHDALAGQALTLGPRGHQRHLPRRPALREPHL